MVRDHAESHDVRVVDLEPLDAEVVSPERPEAFSQALLGANASVARDDADE
jgi:hypothetical protein